MSTTNLVSSLKEGGKTSALGSIKQRLRDALVVLQVAVSLVLLVCAGLFLQSTRNAAQQDLGLKTEGRIVMAMDPELIGYDAPRTRLFYRQLLARMRETPGVERASLGRFLPIGFQNGNYEVFIEGHSREENARAVFNVVSEDYFETLEMLPLQGRILSRQDVQDSKRVTVINQAMAERYWPGQNPLGKRFRFRERDGEPVEVVGVVKTGKYIIPAEKPTPAFYLPLSQNPRSSMVLHVHTGRNAEQMIAAAQRVVQAIDPEMPVWDVRTLSDHIRYGKMRLYDIGTGLIGGFGIIALILAAVGLYGVMAFLVNQRTQEIGVRMALGASQSMVLKSVFMSGIKKTGLGLAAGVPVAVLATSGIRYLLVSVSPTDPRTILSASAFLLIVTMLAIFVPAWRAMRVDPLIALRSE
jgi:predicted permease